MKILSILAITLSAGTLFAQQSEMALDARVQVFGEMARPVAITIVNAGSPIEDQAKRQTGLGLRFMGEIASAPGFYYEVGGKLDSSSNLAFNGDIGGGITADLTHVKFTHSYWSLGAGYMIRPVENLSLGVHLEGRGEALKAQGEIFQNGLSSGQVDASTTYLRPWVRLSADLTVPMGGMRPYFGVDVSAAITRTEQTSFLSADMDNRTLKAMAPKVAAAFYLGMRF